MERGHPTSVSRVYRVAAVGIGRLSQQPAVGSSGCRPRENAPDAFGRSPFPASRNAVYCQYPATGIGAALSRVEELTADSGGDSEYAAYTYLGADSIVKITHPEVSGGLELDYGTGGAYGGFDRFGRVIDQKWQNTAATTTIDRYTYGYDRNSNRLWRENIVARDASKTFDEVYTYDDLDRLAYFRRGDLNDLTPRSISTQDSTRIEAWSLDVLGNWTAYAHDDDGDGALTGDEDVLQSRTHNAANEIDTNNKHTDGPGDSISASAGVNWDDPLYDAAGNMTSGPKPGAISNGTTRHWLVYDAWNRLVQVYQDSDDDGAFEPSGDDSGGLLATYKYDGLHRRVRKTIPGNPAVPYDYYYNTSWQVLEVRKDGDNAYPFKQYIWDLRYIDAPVCRIRDADTDGQNLETLYYTTDANMNVTALVEPDGDVVERYCYDAYGRITTLDADWDAATPSYDNEILYCGYRFDTETGYYNVRYRVYDPGLGRWVQRDPLRYVDGMSLYQYVQSAPTFYYDPGGLFEAGQNDARRRAHEYEEMLRRLKEAGVQPTPRYNQWNDYGGYGDPVPSAEQRYNNQRRWLEQQSRRLGDFADNGYPGHSDFEGNDIFDYNKEDRDPLTSPWNLASTHRHFQPREKSEEQMTKAIANCDKDAFERAAHRFQDFWSHYDKGYRWYTGGHVPDSVLGNTPDGDSDAWRRANDEFRPWVDKWKKECCRNSDGEWVNR